jgi:hypothetical protein
MEENQNLESPHERTVTFGLMAAVIAFVLFMTCIVLWITTSLIRNNLGGSGQSNKTGTASPTVSDTPTLPPVTLTDTVEGPILVDSTWTPVPGGRKYVKFVYWYVKPSKIKVGECLQLTWETQYAVKLQLYRNDQLILADAPPSKTLQDCPKQAGYAVYRLVAENSAGQSNWIQLQVKVEEAP